MKVAAVLACIIALCGSVAFAQSKNASLDDDKFVREALISGTQEIHDGAKYSDAGNAAVQQFAARMVKDHGEANTQLLALARQLHITVPNGMLPPSGAQEQPKGVESPPVTGPANGVDARSYFQKQIDAHQKTIALFKNELSDGSNAKIRDYAKKTLPVLQTHLALAEKDLKSVTH